MSNPSPFRSKLAGLASDFNNATPDQGYGGLGLWPNEGQSQVYTLLVTALKVNYDAKFFFPNGKGKPRGELPGCLIQPTYVWGVAQGNPDGEMTFQGNPIIFPYEKSKVPGPGPDGKGGAQWLVDQALERLKGNLAGLLNLQPNEIEFTAETLDLAQSMIEQAAQKGDPISTQTYLRFKTRKGTGDAAGKTFVEKDDFIRENYTLTGNAPDPVTQTA